MADHPSNQPRSNVNIHYEADGTRVVSRTLKNHQGEVFVIEHRFPDAITHHYQPGLEGEDIPLYSGLFDFSDRENRPFNGEVLFTWQPTPRISARGSRTSTPQEIAELFESNDSNNGMWRTVPGVSIPLTGAVIPKQPECVSDTSQPSRDLHVEERVQTQVGAGESLTDVTFLVPNGWQALDASRVADPGTPEIFWDGRTTATGDGWTVQFDLIPGLTHKKWNGLKKTGGYSFTHTGRLTREDGSSFSSNEAFSALERITLALSLALGRRTACLLPVGYSNGLPKWAHWATAPVDPMKSSSDWLESTCSAKQIGNLIHCVLNFTRKEENLRAFRNALAYYIAANVDVDVHLRASLPISGLQLLTYYEFVTIGPYSPRRWEQAIPKNRGTEWEIRNLIDKLGIAIAVPRHFRHLAVVRDRMRRKGAKRDALGVVIKMRNVATHPTKQQSGDYTVYEWAEAGMLANYWLCLALLYTVGYKGDIAAVLQPRPRNPGELRSTPWQAKPAKQWRVGGKPERR
ncbi:hypothetical protein [Streptomyces asoensis]|uniref:hypothetical protein n=1 Tax=Streptomyces asoensis TaxID=249586 RepID=UPI0033F9CF11